eukprot:TRINITY_DN193_c0_g5_i2.p1 TRINITY_DN193_c0_g5~~TRINITY_DN193_c0_g5_i2.p1  ORF type:complete len:423 (-),score=271.18 TRINITY_DN193_c0_g5_i2:61-1329(-)
MNRINVLASHLCPQSHIQSNSIQTSITANNNNNNNNDDIVVVSALRTPICKGKRGGLRNMFADELLAVVLKETIKTTNISIDKIGDICVGNVLQPGGGALTARMGQFIGGLSYEVPLNTVNRQCSSGLQAFMNITGGIRAGVYDIGIAAGVETMSKNDMMSSVSELSPSVGDCELAQSCLIPMGTTSENVAEKYGLTREKLDQLALSSHQKASIAQQNGYFDKEIVPVNARDDEGNVVVVSKDDGVRPETTLAGLSKLRPAFKEGGSTTAGNSSQVSDGAAAVLVAKRSAANNLGLPILGVLRGYAVVGVPPEIMGIGPAVAIPAALSKAGLDVSQVDIFEINEAFASQAMYCIETLGIPLSKVNPKGGAIALGHPLGCTGARQIATLLHELRRTKQRYGVVSMCIGTGMGAAAVFEAIHDN